MANDRKRKRLPEEARPAPALGAVEEGIPRRSTKHKEHTRLSKKDSKSRKLRHQRGSTAQLDQVNLRESFSSNWKVSDGVVTTTAHGCVITACTLSPTDPSTLYVSTSQSIVQHWNWTSGQKLGRWRLSGQLHGLAVGTQHGTEGPVDVVYTREERNDFWRISIHKLISGAKSSQTESRTVFQSKQLLTAFKIAAGGKAIVAAAGKRLIVGQSPLGVAQSLRDTKYRWQEHRMPDWIVTLDIRGPSSVDHQLGSKADSGFSSSRGLSLDVVVGDNKGVVFVFHDIINRLTDDPKRDAGPSNPTLTPRQLHWHREGVRCVAWSLDGNYILSGGTEMVLVLWQLDTNKKQFLPHLSASIEDVVVSPSGAAYGMRLSDNSAIVLTTAELKPKTYIAGIQALAGLSNLPSGPSVHTVNDERVDTRLADYKVLCPPCAIDPMKPHRLLLAVSSGQNGSASLDSSGSPYLQTFDYHLGHHISRQALARTNATNLSIGPEQHKITEPMVQFLAISENGRWLASVDEWYPPLHSLRYLALEEPDLIEAQHSRREVFLKFWSWNDDTAQWELVTRVNGPHDSSQGKGGTGRVLDLCADPRGREFSSVGEDGVVRIWTARSRLRDNRVVRGADAKALLIWACKHSVSLDCISEHSNLFDPRVGKAMDGNAHLAYSADGSVLAAIFQSSAPGPRGLVHFLDAAGGKICQYRTGLHSGKLSGLGFIERYLVTLSDWLCVWDTVQDSLCYTLKLECMGLSSPERSSLTYLALDQDHNRFAVALPVIGPHQPEPDTQPRRVLDQVCSRVIIFEPTTARPVYSSSTLPAVTSLLPMAGTAAFLTLDLAAEVRVVSPRAEFGLLRISPDATEPTATDLALAERDDPPPRIKYIADTEALQSIRAGASSLADTEMPVIRSEQLREIFDAGPSHSMPPVEELFQQVIGLLKPLTGRS
ncbi:MAG: hypothetical protein M1817_000390 [Caeruleum heppii]|nr:MAG: hypothetical protein M1817_000390 [Caeruleum heppii]